MNPPDAIANLSSDQKRKLLEELLRKQRHSSVWYPLSEGQKGLWVQYQLAPHSAAYISIFCVRVLSALDVPAMKAALQTIFDRHESLRSRFALREGVAMQEFRRAVPLPFSHTDVSKMDDASILDLLAKEGSRPFDLELGPVARFSLFSKSASEHFLLLSMYHIAFDHWSLNLILDELRVLYPAAASGQAVSLSEVAAGYSDYVRWQKELLVGSEGEKLWRYWQGKLSGELPALALPTDRPRPKNELFEGKSLPFRLKPELTSRLRALAKAEGKTLFSTLLAAFQLLLHRYSGQDDILVGSPTLGLRRPEFQKVVGYFTNLVPLRADLSGDPSFREHLSRVQKTVLEAMDHQEFPFPLLVQRLQPVRDPSRSPIFQVQFNLIRVPKNDLGAEAHITAETRRVELGGLILEPVHLPQQEGQFDLDLMMVEEADSISGPIKYRSDLFDRSTIERMASHLEGLLESVVERPDVPISELSMISSEENKLLLFDLNRTQARIGCERVHELFEASAERAPEAPAIRFRGATITYKELNARANRIARHLRTNGVEPGALVAVCLERSPDMVAALLGVLKVGAAYVPVDPAYPEARVAFMLEHSGAAALVTQESLAVRLARPGILVVRLDADKQALAAQSAENLENTGSGDDLMYVIYTSGSTGQPKGVAIRHRAVANVLRYFAGEFGIGVDDSLLAVTTLSFDIAVLELFLPLATGSRLVLAERADALDGGRLSSMLSSESITVMQATPVTWKLLLASGWNNGSKLRILCGGEAWTSELAQRLLDSGASLWNVYGPTETTIWSTCRSIARGEPIRLGSPIANTRIYVLDTRLRPVPPGIAGDLYIAGVGLASGYWNRPDLTQERFVADPHFSGELMYKTGDVARRLANGELEFLGRADHQVKIRGFRIEIGEIEAILRRCPGVVEAVVVARAAAAGEQELVGYVVVSVGKETATDEVRSHLKKSLPEYMIPAAIVALPRLPLTPNGKIDRKALPEPIFECRAATAEPIAPSSSTEKAIVDVWASVLRREIVSIDDNFFELGGHSLALLEVQARLKRALERDIPTVAMFSHPTVRSLASYLRGESENRESDGDKRRQDLSRQRTARLEHRRRESHS